MFTHLHLHTQYSLLDGACKIDRLLDKIAAMGMTSCAITDHGAMYGVVDFYQQCLKRSIKPIIGCEVYICPNMRDKTAAARDYGHLILLCENQTGYRNLVKLVSAGFTEGFYYKPRIDYDLLREHSDGLIALSACLSGDLPRLLLDGRRDEARAVARRYMDIFGEKHFYVELQDHGLPEQKRVLPELIQLADDCKLPLVVTNDCHYINRDDAAAQEILMCIQTGKTLADDARMRMDTEELYVKSEGEMRERFPDFDDAFANTCEIAERCNVTFDFGTRHLPHYPLEPGQDAATLLETLCETGLRARYGDREDAKARLDYELGVIRQMGFVDYFLIVWDFIRYAREQGILVGPGRGSGAGSIVAYTLGITAIDPLRYQLLFERFLNPERISMPDLDIDFDYERRGEVIEYVARRYGQDHVAQIITFGTMAAKLVIRDVGRVMGMSYQEVDAVAKMIPFALDITLEKALQQNPAFQAACDGDERIARLVDTAKKLEGMPRHASTHAAGVLITADPVSDLVPLQTNDDVITTQFPMGTLEALGLLKMDFLGLRTLNVIGDSLEMARARCDISMKPEDIPLDDPAVYQMISAGDTDGIFQLESTGMRNFLTAMKPGSFEDIIAAISLYRPGPMESIPRYIAGKQNPDTVRYADEKLRPILGVTYGCMVYQEQVMQIVRDLAGYSLGRSDLVRRAMSKKKHDVMAKEKEYFIHGKLAEDGSIEVPGALRNGVPEAVAEQLFEEMTAFASYAFNKSHAAAYGVVAVQTAWLKAHYPVEFMAALMNSVIGNADKVAFYIQSCRKAKISILPPDINRSKERFSVEDGKIRFALSAVKNVGRGAIRSVEADIAQNGAYRDLTDFAGRASGLGVNKKAVESLIRAGALDALPGNRAQKLAAYEMAMDGVARARKKVVEGQISFFGGDFEVEAPREELPRMADFSPRALLQMEKETTGVYVTGHPLDEYAADLALLPVNYQYLANLAEEPDRGLSQDGRRVVMGGLIAEKRTKATRSGGMMGFVQLEDLYGVTEALVFPRVLERLSEKLNTDQAVLCAGKLSIREDEAPKLLLDELMPLTPGAVSRGEAARLLAKRENGRGAPAKVAADGAAAGLAPFGGATSFGGDPGDGTYGFADKPGADPGSGFYGLADKDAPGKPGADPGSGFYGLADIDAPGKRAASAPAFRAGFDESALPPEMRARAYVPLRGDDPRVLTLRIPDRDAREACARLLMSTPGAIRVRFDVAGEILPAPRNLSVCEQFQRAALETLLGADAVSLA